MILKIFKIYDETIFLSDTDTEKTVKVVPLIVR